MPASFPYINTISKRLTVIIPMWLETHELISTAQLCVASYQKYLPDVPIIIVDDCAKYSVKAHIAGEYTLLTNSRNKGFAHAVNLGVERAETQYCLTVGSDTELISCLPVKEALDLCLSNRYFVKLRDSKYQSTLMDNGFNGCVFSKHLFQQLGGFDKFYTVRKDYTPMGWEDTDFHHTLYANNIEIKITHNGDFIHHGGMSSGKSTEALRDRDSDSFDQNFLKGFEYFKKKWGYPEEFTPEEYWPIPKEVKRNFTHWKSEKRLDICFVDLHGLEYSYTTLESGTVGGSEAALINLTQTFSNFGHSVTVFNNCTEEGKFNGVVWLDISKISTITKKFDVVIASRGLDCCNPHHEYYVNGRVKILWMHDYFIHNFMQEEQQAEGLTLVEEYINKNWLDYIFTLSDWHSQYILNSFSKEHSNGFSRYKRNIIQTRNGFKPWPQDSHSRKDKNKFVYFSNAGRGLHQLLYNWHLIKLSIPDAQLHVIGGSYTSDAEKDKWLQHYKEEFKEQKDIHFIPGMPQKELFKELSSAYLTIYPCQYEETFCISALDSMYNGTPLVTSRYGALEQTAIAEANVLVDGMSFESDYFEKFIPAVTRLYYDRDYWIAKVESCNIIRDNFVTWEAVGIEWLAIFSKLTSIDIDDPLMEEARNSIRWINQTFKCTNTTLENL